jgi:Flp pilus assembly pilin Flp
MSDSRASEMRTPKRGSIWDRFTSRNRRDGQALIEYVLILALVTIALIAVLAITGPAVGNVFSNAVFNLLGGTVEPRNTLEANDFWTQVAAVASYTPENPSLVTNTPAPHTSTPTIGPSPTPTGITPSPPPSDTPTPGPSPTPPDQNFGYPFEDPAENPDWWKHDFESPILGPWNAEFWDLAYANGTAPQADMSSMPPGSGKWTTTYPDPLDQYWSYSPGGTVERNFYGRFTNTARLGNQQYTLKVRKDDGVRIWVAGTLVVDEWSYNPRGDAWFETTFTPSSTGDVEIKVELYDGGYGARIGVQLSDNKNLLDKGDCNWAVSGEAYRSAPTAWSDSPGANYAPYSYCILALRGYIDLRGSTNPFFEFWDRYDLHWGGYARVGIAVAGTGNWTDVQLHNNEANLGWSRQTFDLKNFGDPDGTGPAVGNDYSNELIEIRFIMDNKNSSSSDDGWWIDDIKVQEQVIKRYTIGFSDDMEGASHWYAGGTWARTNEQAHSGIQAWSDSPGGDYVHGSNSILELDGVIVLDNDQLDGNPVVDPEVVFWHKYNLTYNDSIWIEVSNNNRQSWVPLTGSYIAYQTTNLSWVQQVISLSDYVDQLIYMRFRIDATSSSYVADGWWIDDYSLRNKPDTVITPDWCDNMETGGSEWIPDGTWAVVNGLDYNPETSQTVMAHSGTQFWSDSPQTNYLDDTNSSLQLRAKVDLSAAVNPEISFWQQWDVNYADDLYLEVSEDDGNSWSTVWTYQYNNLPPGYRYVVDHGYNDHLSWVHDSISLRDYVGSVIRLRFRLDALYHSYVADGWWLDDVCIQEYNEPLRKLPFRDGFEQGPENWYVGGDWSISSENKYTGALAFSDSYGVPYRDDTNSILELRGPLDLTGVSQPTIYFWEAFNLNYEDYTLVEINVSDNGGLTWNGWDEIYQHRYTTTTSWDRRQVSANLVDYVGKLVRLRFRLYAVRDSRVADGWWIDDVSIVDRVGTEPTFPLPFNESVDAENDYWVKDGTWSRIPSPREVDSGTAVGPGGWTAEYYYKTSGCSQPRFTDATFFTTTVDAAINFNWGSGSPKPNGLSLPSDDCFQIRWTRTIDVAADGTTYQIKTTTDDGVRVAVDPTSDPHTDPNYVANWTWVTYEWRDRGPTTETRSVTLDAGPHVFVVEYYENGGGAVAQLSFIINGYVFTDSPAGNYFHNNDMAITLEGVIDLAGTNNPALSYWDRRDLGWGDTVYTEVSSDGGFTWDIVRQTGGDDNTWTKRLIDLSAYAGDKINIRFRLDGRGGSSSSISDGWYIDDILVAD